MKYLSSKIKLTFQSYDQVLDCISKIHHINFNMIDGLSQHDDITIIKDAHYSAIRIMNNHIYEYVYVHHTNELLVHIDKRNDSQIINIIDRLINNNLVDQSSQLYVSHNAFHLSSFDNSFDLPVIFVSKKLKREDLISKLASKLKGMAYVIYGDEEFDKHMSIMHDAHTSTIFLKNNERFSLFKFTKEDDDAFIDRIFMKIQEYTTKLEYSYSFHNLYKSYLDTTIKHAKEQEETISYSLEDQLLKIELEKEDYQERIEKLLNEIELLEYQVDIYKERIKTKDSHPILYKGNIDEYYQDEQKEIVLSLIHDKLKTTRDSKTIDILHSIIDENPSSELRDIMLANIENALLASSKLNGRMSEELRKNGLIESHEFNDPKHHWFLFYKNPRYTIDIASSPSDKNWGKKTYRKIRDICF